MVRTLGPAALLALAIVMPMQPAAAQNPVGGAIVGGALGGIIGGAVGRGPGGFGPPPGGGGPGRFGPPGRSGRPPQGFEILPRFLEDRLKLSDEQKKQLERAESAGNVAAAAQFRYGALKYLEEQRADLEAQAGNSERRQCCPTKWRPLILPK